VYRQARRSGDALFTVLTRDNALATARLGLSMPARVVGNAVRRNLVKRLVRESFRLHQHDLPAADIVVNARSAVRTADNNAILRSLERHWQNVSLACARS
jgi:ribonuclease P protein component